MNRAVVLICDDSTAVQESLGEYLTIEGFKCIHALDGTTCIKTVNEQHVDVVILDIMLPDMSGLDVCRKIKEISSVPILMLSARGDTLDRVVGLELGADDYVGKPFSLREVTVRIKKIMDRHTVSNEPRALSFANLILYPESNKASVSGKQIELTVKECKALLYLLSNQERTSSREHIINAIWGYEYYGDTRVIDTLIKRLRQKICTPNANFEIKSIYGVGYIISELEKN